MRSGWMTRSTMLPSARSDSEAVPEIRIPLVGPAGEPVNFRATINSHGVAALPPARPDADLATQLATTLRLPGEAICTVTLREPEQGVLGIDSPADAPVDEVVAIVRHMLRLDQDLSAFYALAASDPMLNWVCDGFGRMMRCQTVYEDVIKTVLTTNCAWSATERMVERLVVELGEPDPVAEVDPPWGRAFPTPAAMAARDEAFYRDVVRAGYRAPHLVKLSTAVDTGELDLESLGAATVDSLPDEELAARLLELPGVGPYAAAHIMHMLGRQSRLILDSWTRLTYARLIQAETISDAEIAEAHSRYGEWAGLAFWMAVTRVWFEDQATGEAG